MPERQYSIQPANQVGNTSRTSARMPISPPNTYNQTLSPGFNQPPPAPVSLSASPVRRPQHSHERYESPTRAHRSSPQGPPPQHHGRPSPTRYRQAPAMRYQASYAPPIAATDLSSDIVDVQPPDNGFDALRDVDDLFGGRIPMSPSPEPDEPPTQYRGSPARYPVGFNDSPPRPPAHGRVNSQSSVAPLYAGAARHEQYHSPPKGYSDHVYPNTPSPVRYAGYQGDGYDDYMSADERADDPFDDKNNMPRQKRKRGPPAGIAAAGAMGGAGGMSRAFGSGNPSGNYAPLSGAGRTSRESEKKSEWLQEQSGISKRTKRIIWIVVALVIVAAIIGGVAGGILASNTSSDGSSSGSPASSAKDGLYDINSPQVKKLLNNDALHRVFPGMDYTPLNAQYPACLTNPIDQNNVTLDVAMLAQLTPAIRLYGTDCNQTEMVLSAINRLNYNATVKVWLGVWLGTNATTNSRQLEQMYDILDIYPTTHFAGVIVGNEVLFREDLTPTELGTQLSSVRANLTAKNIDLPVATSDLGDDWTSTLASETDIVMANVHPFFAGVKPDAAPGWTWSFWQDHDVVLAAEPATGSYPKHIIAETGWPSEGGNDCGTEDGCASETAGAVASIANMNTFMDGWVCQSLTNGTTYFWFEAFDEPWKVEFDTDTDKWESKWGLMDSNRNVKDGLKIPDCGGKTVDKPY